MDLNEARQLFPELQGKSDTDAVDMLQRNVYPDWDHEQLATALGAKLEAPKPAAALKPTDGDFVRGLKDSMRQVPQTIGGTLGLVGDAIGSDGLRDYGMDVYKKYDDQIKAGAKPSDSFTDTLAGNGNWTDFLAHGAGYVGGQAVQALATGGVGAFIGKKAAALAAEKGVAKAVAARIAEHEAGLAAMPAAERALAAPAVEAADQALAQRAGQMLGGQAAQTGAKVGAATALGASNYVQEAGSIYPDAVEQAQKDGRTLTGADLARVAGSAALAAGVETATDSKFLSALHGGGRKMVTDAAGNLVPESLGRALAREGLKGAAREAGTEGVQTEIERFGAQKSLGDKEAMRDVVDSMALGALGGAGGGAGSAFRTQKVPNVGPLSNAVNTGLEAAAQQAESAPLLLENKPSSMYTFPDGSMGNEDDVNHYVATIPDPEVRARVKADIMGLDPETGAKIPTDIESQAKIKQYGMLHSPMPLQLAEDQVQAKPNMAIVPHPSGAGFAVVPAQWVSPNIQAQAIGAAREAKAQQALADQKRTEQSQAQQDAEQEQYAQQQAQAAGAQAAQQKAAIETAQQPQRPVSPANPRYDVPATPAGSFAAVDQLAQQHANLIAQDRLQRASKLESIANNVAEADRQRTMNDRAHLLDDVLADPNIANPVDAFKAALSQAGYRRDAIHPDEQARIDKHAELTDAFGQADTIPAAPNEMPADLVKEKVAPAAPAAPAMPPNLLLNAKGGPFKSMVAAQKKLREIKGAGRILQVPGGFAVEPGVRSHAAEQASQKAQPEAVAAQVAEPVAQEAPAAPEPDPVPPAQAMPKPAAPAAKPRNPARDHLERTNPFLAFVGQHGIAMEHRNDTGGTDGNRMIPGFGPAYRKAGLGLDELAIRAHEAGFLSDADMANPRDNGGVRKLADLIERGVHKREVVQHAAGNEAAYEAEAKNRELTEMHAAAEAMGIEGHEQMDADQLHDAIREKQAELIGAEDEDDFRNIEDMADAIEKAGITDEQIDAAWDMAVNQQELSDADIEKLFSGELHASHDAGAASEGGDAAEAAQGSGRDERSHPEPATGDAKPAAGAGTVNDGERPAADERAAEADFGLTRQTADEARAEQARNEQAAKDRAKAERDAARAERERLDAKETDRRIQDSADHFQLGQSAEEAVSGQADLLSQPAQEEAKPRTRAEIEADIADLSKIAKSRMAEAHANKGVGVAISGSEIEHLTEQEKALRHELFLELQKHEQDDRLAASERIKAKIEARNAARTAPLDHGELNIPGRTANINAELDRHKRKQEKTRKATAKEAAAQRREDKARAQALYAEQGPAMVEQIGASMQAKGTGSPKEVKASLEDMVKWEPAKFLKIVDKWQQEQAVPQAEAAPEAVAKQDILGPEKTRYAGIYGKGMTAFNARIEAKKRDRAHPELIHHIEEAPQHGADRYEVVGYERPPVSSEDLQGREDTLGRGPTSFSSPLDTTLIQAITVGVKVRNVLNAIADYAENTQYRELAQRLAAMNLDTTIGIGRAEEHNFAAGGNAAGYVAGYSPSRDHVFLFSAKDTTQNVLHELTHAATFKAIRANGLATRQMESLYAHVQQQEGMASEYGMSNLDEFVAEAFTNPEFQDKLRALPAAPNGTSRFASAWHKFVSIVRSILGMKNGNVLDQVMQAGHRLMDENQQARAAASAGEPVLGNLSAAIKRGANMAANAGNRMQGDEKRSNYLGNLTAAQEAALKRVGGITTPKTLQERYAEFRKDLSMRIKQGMADQFAPIQNLDQKAYVMARLSKASDGTLEAALMYGKPFIKDGVADVNAKEGGFAQVLSKLDGEHDRFLWWVAAQRAERLKAEGRENLFMSPDIADLKTLDQPDAQHPQRAAKFAEALKELNDFNDSVLKVAEDSGLIDPETRKLFQDQPYVPFYRAMEDENKYHGANFSDRLVNQKALIRLEGGTDKLKNDLLANLLRNWSNLYAASAKNRAAIETMKAAVPAQAATEVPAGTPESVRVYHDGKAKSYVINDPHLYQAVAAMTAPTPAWFKPFAAFKRAMTFGVTANPAFKIRNLIRDSVSAIAQGEMSYNPLRNVTQGYASTAHGSQTHASMLASGGIVRFGDMLDGDSADKVHRLIRKGIAKDQILDESGWKKLSTMANDVLHAYAEFGDRLENVNRAALYEQMRAKGYSHADASFAARDLLDFSMRGQWPVVRFLTSSVPFLNARIQGLYKLGRATAEDPKRAAIVLGAVTAASLGLLMAYHDDEDWKKREDWDRDSYWFFKVGGKAFRIPKPFEIGAAATIAERTWELGTDPEMKVGRYGKRVADLIQQQFSMNPMPQIIRPFVDVYANKDSFTSRPIVSPGMEKLRPQDRSTEHTTGTVRLLGQMGLPDPMQLVQGRYEPLSPVQWDYLLKGYLGWTGTAVMTAADTIARPIMGEGEKADMRLRDTFLIGNFVESLPTGSSRYVTQLYDQAKEIEQAYDSYRNAIKQGDLAGAAKIVADDGDLIRQHGAIEHTKQALSKINAQLKRVKENGELSGEQKRVLIDRLEAMKVKVAQPRAA